MQLLVKGRLSLNVEMEILFFEGNQMFGLYDANCGIKFTYSFFNEY
jgi:hypothetical protein